MMVAHRERCQPLELEALESLPEEAKQRLATRQRP